MSNTTIKFTAPGMDNDAAEKTIEVLEKRLVALLDLQLTLKHIHWNVVGPNFIGVHEMLDPQVDAVRGMTDTIAELLVGVIADPAHGYVLTLAAGGTLTELIEDRACVLLPATRSEIGDTLSQLRISRILEGYRGRPAANINAILDAIMAVTAYVSAYQPAEIEINPYDWPRL